MKLKTTKSWTTRAGQRRRVPLYRAYMNMKARIAGTASAGDGTTPWKGLSTDFKDFEDFRAWALANGYSRIRCSLDRYPFPEDGYVRSNLRWVTISANTIFENQCRWHGVPVSKDLDDLLALQYPTANP